MVKWRNDDDDGDDEEDDFYELRWLYFIETFNGKQLILSLLFEQEILTDPAMKIILDQMQEDPKAAQE